MMSQSKYYLLKGKFISTKVHVFFFVVFVQTTSNLKSLFNPYI